MGLPIALQAIKALSQAEVDREQAASRAAIS
jgi:hypothetical protein